MALRVEVGTFTGTSPVNTLLPGVRSRFSHNLGEKYEQSLFRDYKQTVEKM